MLQLYQHDPEHFAFVVEGHRDLSSAAISTLLSGRAGVTVGELEAVLKPDERARAELRARAARA